MPKTSASGVSASPGAKIKAADRVGAGGARYVEAAVMTGELSIQHLVALDEQDVGHLAWFK